MLGSRFSRFSLLPPCLSSPSLSRRCLPFHLVFFVPSYRSQPLHVLTVPNRHQPAIRSMSTNANSEDVKLPKSVHVSVAHELLQAGHSYLDVRTIEEFNAGRAVGATNIPYMFKTGFGMTKNQNFLEEVASVFGKDDEIIVGCQSGRRSLMAASDLSTAGFTCITDVAGGYAAWVQNGLPTEK